MSGDGWPSVLWAVLLGGLLRAPVEVRHHLHFPVAAVAAEGADAGQLLFRRPSRDGLDVDAEQGGDLRRGEQGLDLGRLLSHQYYSRYTKHHAGA